MLKVPLGRWSNKTQQKWKWYYNKGNNEVYQIDGKAMEYYRCETSWCQTRSTTSYHLVRLETSPINSPQGVLTLVIVLSSNRVHKLQEGSDLLQEPLTDLSFWEYITTWGGNWMWEDINNSQTTKADTMWIAEG
jgi:hypothetical protein